MNQVQLRGSGRTSYPLNGDQQIVDLTYGIRTHLQNNQVNLVVIRELNRLIDRLIEILDAFVYKFFISGTSQFFSMESTAHET